MDRLWGVVTAAAAADPPPCSSNTSAKMLLVLWLLLLLLPSSRIGGILEMLCSEARRLWEVVGRLLRRAWAEAVGAGGERGRAIVVWWPGKNDNVGETGGEADVEREPAVDSGIGERGGNVGGDDKGAAAVDITPGKVSWLSSSDIFLVLCISCSQRFT